LFGRPPRGPLGPAISSETLRIPGTAPPIRARTWDHHIAVPRSP
jgi:hypothetical protein